ncbi:MAG: glycosyltransferase family 2 protein [Clostridia bacterium]|nr:glycosyltransferase family 2 protein [Clostridia bacterium]
MWVDIVREVVTVLNYVLAALFFLAYLYQLIYIIVGLVNKKPKYNPAQKNHRIAVVISARNEEKVLPQLIDSIHKQNYPQELIDIMVIADNCTDSTPQLARDMGAYVYERHNDKLIGKGYALDELFAHLMENGKVDDYDAYLVLDADNLLMPNYISEMNRVFDNGYGILTSYRNSKNFLQNWITAGYGLWFLREARYLNNPRHQLGTSCIVSGTGFMFGTEVIKKYGGWKFHLLTEDIEFSTNYVLDGGKIGYAADAMFYDEQPTTFSKAWNQRTRWAKGFYQVVGKYGKGLFKGMFGNFSCYDVMMNITPAMLISIGMVLVNLIAFILGACTGSFELLKAALMGIAGTVVYFYCFLFVVGLITMITEWDVIKGSKGRKIWCVFTFPIFMFTYFPIAVYALFKKEVVWKPIEHIDGKSIDDMTK